MEFYPIFSRIRGKRRSTHGDHRRQLRQSAVPALRDFFTQFLFYVPRK